MSITARDWSTVAYVKRKCITTWATSKSALQFKKKYTSIEIMRGCLRIKILIKISEKPNHSFYMINFVPRQNQGIFGRIKEENKYANAQGPILKIPSSSQ